MKKLSLNSNSAIIVALALSAASALMYEVVATHILFFYYIESSYSISTVLSVFMLGLGIGSYGVYRLLPRIVYKQQFFGLLQLCIGIYAVVILSRLDQIVPTISDWGVLSTSILVLLLPTIFLGAAFPMAAALFNKNKHDITGLVYSSDLIGAVFGSIISGFFLIPHIGNGLTIIVGANLNFAAATIIFATVKNIKLVFSAIVCIVISWTLVLSYPHFLENKQIVQNVYHPKEFFSNSPYGPVKVINKTLYVNNKDMCSLEYPESASEKMMVDYAVGPLGIKNAKTLNIGLGCGLTLEKLLKKTNQVVDVVEINPQVVEANRTMTNVLANKKVHLIIDDGLKYVRKTQVKYDSILVDIEDPTVAHSSGLYTTEAFMAMAHSLNNNGTLSFWRYSIKKSEYTDILYYSLKQAFAHVYTYQGVFVASQALYDAEEYQPSTPFKINTLDKNTLTDAFLKGD